MPHRSPPIFAAPPGSGPQKFSDNRDDKTAGDDRGGGARPAPTQGADQTLSETLTKIQDTLGEHKGKLAIGAAATLGLMIFYNWREKKLAKEDPQEYARLQRFKNSIRADDALDKAAKAEGNDSPHRDRSK